MPTLSAVAVEVMQRCQDDDLDFNEIDRVIGRDPALSIKILKAANSPLFGLRQEVRSIYQALGILGLHSVRTLVLSFSLVRDSEQEREGPLAACWKRSVVAAIAARELCEGQSQALREEVYLAGLLQDVGIMAFARAFGGSYARLHAKPGMTHDSLRAAELAACGADHAEVGAWLLEGWGVSAELVKLVRFSHDSSRLSGESPELLAMARRVEYSGRLADLWSNRDADAAIRMAEAEAAALFGEGVIDIAALGARIMTSVAAVAPLFEVTIDNEEMSLVVEQAQELMASSVMRLQAATESLRSTARRDALTGLFNRGSLDAHLKHRFQGTNLERIGVLFADIDHFKRVNDAHGHAAGDAVLRSVAQRLSASARAGDFVGRYGGEEFLIVLELEDEREIMDVAERIRAAVEHPSHPLSNEKALPITISIGCATAKPGRHREYQELVEDADRALYAAKHGGRNRVVRAGTAPQDKAATAVIAKA